MGLAGPRKRVKLSHDPNNTAWTTTHSDPSLSFGSRYMHKSGWVPGTALGASSIPIDQATSSKVRIAVKDDTLGLGASLKSRNVEHQRTGLDAFQGLLGRLNAKDEGALKQVEEKIEQKKLAMFAQGRWGGMVFVPGGLLVQDDPEKTVPVLSEPEYKITEQQSAADASQHEAIDDADTTTTETKSSKTHKRKHETDEERAHRKAEKRRRKDDKAARKEAKRLKRSLKASGVASSPASVLATPELTDTNMSTGTNTPLSAPETPSATVVANTANTAARNGRAIIRSRNYAAKRMAFSDAKGLDQIFMRPTQTA